MPKIRVLEKQIAELIAAGEVVERPSSVIKELVENSVDSGASVITVEIRNGGITFMRVTDNGCGIAPEDVPTAFLRHATSKIVREDDLDAIGTLGFRGEALASIAAVAHVELLTRARGAETGCRYTGGGAEAPSLEEAGCPEGTTILVRDLFFNTPARMKFLKKDSTEGNAIAGILDKIALSHPEISFRFLRDGKEQLHTPGDNKLSSAIYAVYGKEFYSTLLPVEYELNHIKVAGFVSAPSGSRPNRSMQNFFINGRYIRSRTAGVALEEAYKGSIMVGKFPACVLHLSLSLEAVDVNVHPAKLEVRFVNERPIFDAVYHAVKSALAVGDKPKVMSFRKPVLPFETPAERQEQLHFPRQGQNMSQNIELPHQPQPPIHSHSASELPKQAAPQQREAINGGLLQDSGAIGPAQEMPSSFERFLKNVLDSAPLPQQEALSSEADAKPVSENKSNPAFVREEAASFADPKEKKCPEPNEPGKEFHVRLLGEAFGTYLILEYDSESLMLIDKHAAHERLLYEKLKARENGGEAQTLLEPVAVTLAKEEYAAVLEHAEQLYQVGFEVEDFGAGTVLVRSAPLLLDGADASAAIMEIAGYLASFKTDLTTERLDWVYHNVACRAAIKAGDTSSREELIALARELEENPQVRYCPHGRPVFILIRKKDIERQFGRA